MIRALVWTLNRIGLVEVARGSLLAIGLLSVVMGLSQVVRDLEIGLLSLVLLVGMAAGWMLARTRIDSRGATLYLLVGGLGVLLLWVGHLWPNVGAVVRDMIRSLAVALRLDTPARVAFAPLGESVSDLVQAVLVVLQRWFGWAGALVFGEPAVDPLAVGLSWGLMVWALAAWAGWVFRRAGRPLAALAPSGGLLAASLAYSYGSPIYLVGFLLATLLLVVVEGQIKRERSWILGGLDFPQEAGIELLAIGSALAIVLVMLGMALPSLSISQILQAMERWRGDLAEESQQVAGSLGLRDRTAQSVEEVGGAFRPMARPSLPRQHLIGSSPDLAEIEVLWINVSDPGRTTELGADPQDLPARLYWRSVTFDQYNGRGWSTGTYLLAVHGPGDVIQARGLPGQRLVQQEVRVRTEGWGGLYAAGTLATADQAIEVGRRTTALAGEAAAPESAEIDLFGATVSANHYLVESWVSDPGEAQLREAVGSYPEWVQDRYLELPAEVPARVRRLARELTATQLTPYDRAQAIEAYLRTYPYSLEVPEPPVDREVADYFLFDLKEGYCDYYATAMVVLARAAGLPARLVMGYASGSYNLEEELYVVTEADAHSWVEVYFPEFGWVEFEPTAGLPVLLRSETGTVAQEGEADLVPGMMADRGPPAYWRRGLVILALSGGVLLLAAGAALAYGYWRLTRMPPNVAVAAVYRALYRLGRRLGVDPLPGDTPHEVIDGLKNRRRVLVGVGQDGSGVDPLDLGLDTIVDVYTQGAYGPRPLTGEQAAGVLDHWIRLRGRLWRLWVRRRWLAVGSRVGRRVGINQEGRNDRGKRD